MTDLVEQHIHSPSSNQAKQLFSTASTSTIVPITNTNNVSNSYIAISSPSRLSPLLIPPPQTSNLNFQQNNYFPELLKKSLLCASTTFLHKMFNHIEELHVKENLNGDEQLDIDIQKLLLTTSSAKLSINPPIPFQTQIFSLNFSSIPTDSKYREENTIENSSTFDPVRNCRAVCCAFFPSSNFLLF